MISIWMNRTFCKCVWIRLMRVLKLCPMFRFHLMAQWFIVTWCHLRWWSALIKSQVNNAALYGAHNNCQNIVIISKMCPRECRFVAQWNAQSKTWKLHSFLNDNSVTLDPWQGILSELNISEFIYVLIVDQWELIIGDNWPIKSQETTFLFMPKTHCSNYL